MSLRRSVTFACPEKRQPKANAQAASWLCVTRINKCSIFSIGKRILDTLPLLTPDILQEIAK